MGSALASLAAWALLVEPRRTRVRRVPLALDGWPAALDGFRVLVVSDLHAGAPHVGVDRLDAVVERANRERADLVALLGDFVDTEIPLGTRVVPEAVAERMGRLSSRHGSFAVLGNHDWDNDGRRVSGALRAQGIAVLENDAVHVTGDLWVAGLSYVSVHGHAGETLGPVPDDATVIVLSHHPDLFERIPGRVALVLAGHTHGAQVNLPGLRRLTTPSRFGARYAGGLVEEGGKAMYVTRGLGTSRFPVRLAAPSEVVVLELRQR